MEIRDACADVTVYANKEKDAFTHITPGNSKKATKSYKLTKEPCVLMNICVPLYEVIHREYLNGYRISYTEKN